MDTLLKIIIALSFSGVATLTTWLLVEAADAVLRHKRGKGEDDGDGFELDAPAKGKQMG